MEFRVASRSVCNLNSASLALQRRLHTGMRQCAGGLRGAHSRGPAAMASAFRPAPCSLFDPELKHREHNYRISSPAANAHTSGRPATSTSTASSPNVGTGRRKFAISGRFQVRTIKSTKLCSRGLPGQNEKWSGLKVCSNEARTSTAGQTCQTPARVLELT